MMPAPLATSNLRYLAPGNAYQFRIQAIDNAGLVSPVANGTPFELVLWQEGDSATHYSTGWQLRAHSWASGGGLRVSSAAMLGSGPETTSTRASMVSSASRSSCGVTGRRARVISIM